MQPDSFPIALLYEKEMIPLQSISTPPSNATLEGSERHCCELRPATPQAQTTREAQFNIPDSRDSTVSVSDLRITSAMWNTAAVCLRSYKCENSHVLTSTKVVIHFKCLYKKGGWDIFPVNQFAGIHAPTHQ